jgi:hypothetical protein
MTKNERIMAFGNQLAALPDEVLEEVLGDWEKQLNQRVKLSAAAVPPELAHVRRVLGR